MRKAQTAQLTDGVTKHKLLTVLNTESQSKGTQHMLKCLK
jgi:hypothetical protein